MERHGQNDNKMGEDFKFGFIGLLGFREKGFSMRCRKRPKLPQSG